MREIPPVIPPPLGQQPLQEFQGSKDGRAGDYNTDVPQRYNPVLRAVCSRVGAQFVTMWDAHMAYPRKDDLWSQKSTWMLAQRVNHPMLHWHCEINTKVCETVRNLGGVEQY